MHDSVLLRNAFIFVTLPCFASSNASLATTACSRKKLSDKPHCYRIFDDILAQTPTVVSSVDVIFNEYTAAVISL
jgi:hypothetical protein